MHAADEAVRHRWCEIRGQQEGIAHRQRPVASLDLVAIPQDGGGEIRPLFLRQQFEQGHIAHLIESHQHGIVENAVRQTALHEVLSYLDTLACAGSLNNANIPRMVRNYFFEMCFVVFELARVLRRGGRVVMVNDNVRYAGASVSVDIILSEIAQKIGFDIESILVLPNGKGNSSQQMGSHGRDPLRKCVYVWRKR